MARRLRRAEPADQRHPVITFHPDDEPVSAMTAPFLTMAVDRRHLLVMRQITPPEDAAGPEATIPDAYRGDTVTVRGRVRRVPVK